MISEVQRDSCILAMDALCYVATNGPERRTSDILEQLEQWEPIFTCVQ